jgi:pyruvate dehydrogenase E1 component beta subunit
MRELRGNQALCEALSQEMADDERVFLLGEDLARHGGVFRVTEGLLEQFGPRRVIDSPISESGIVGAGVGAAQMGMRPVIEIQFTDLITIAMDQIANSAAKGRYAHNGAMHVPLVVRTVNLGKGTIYASQAWEAWLTHVPGLKVVMPADPHNAKGLLISAIRDPDPVIFIEPRELYGMRGPVPEESYTVPFGKANIRREGSDVTLVTFGNMVRTALEVAEKIADEGLSVEVIDPQTLVPLDRQTLVQSVCKTGRLVVAHEAVKRSGFGAEIVAEIVDSEAFEYLQAPIVRVANPGVPVPHSKALHKLALPDENDLTSAIRRVMDYT